MAASFIENAKQLLSYAVSQEEDGNLAEAIKIYKEGIGELLKEIKSYKNPSLTKDKLRLKVDNYIDHVKYLKERLQTKLENHTEILDDNNVVAESSSSCVSSQALVSNSASLPSTSFQSLILTPSTLSQQSSPVETFTAQPAATGGHLCSASASSGAYSAQSASSSSNDSIPSQGSAPLHFDSSRQSFSSSFPQPSCSVPPAPTFPQSSSSSLSSSAPSAQSSSSFPQSSSSSQSQSVDRYQPFTYTPSTIPAAAYDVATAIAPAGMSSAAYQPYQPNIPAFSSSTSSEYQYNTSLPCSSTAQYSRRASASSSSSLSSFPPSSSSLPSFSSASSYASAPASLQFFPSPSSSCCSASSSSFQPNQSFNSSASSMASSSSMSSYHSVPSNPSPAQTFFSSSETPLVSPSAHHATLNSTSGMSSTGFRSEVPLASSGGQNLQSSIQYTLQPFSLPDQYTTFNSNSVRPPPPQLPSSSASPYNVQPSAPNFSTSSSGQDLRPLPVSASSPFQQGATSCPQFPSSSSQYPSATHSSLNSSASINPSAPPVNMHFPSARPLSQSGPPGRCQGWLRPMVGLANLAQSCYMNAPLQCLASTGPLMMALLVEQRHVKDARLGSTRQFLDGMVGVFTQLHAKRDGEYLFPQTVKALVDQVDGKFQGSAQQDAMDLYEVVMNELHRCVNRAQGQLPTYGQVRSLSAGVDSSNADSSWTYAKAQDDSFVNDLFDYQLETRISCRYCNKAVSGNFQVTRYLMSLPLPAQIYQTTTQDAKQETVHLMECLRLFFFRDEVLSDYRCPKCGKKDGCRQTTFLKRMPTILALQIKRRGPNGKAGCFIQYPETLTLEEFLSDSAPAVYDLYAVVNHIDSAQQLRQSAKLAPTTRVPIPSSNSGHYHAYCLGAGRQDQWAWFNDSKVTPIPPSQVSSVIVRDAGSSLLAGLFYQRRQ